jgi:hypothetical protein
MWTVTVMKVDPCHVNPRSAEIKAGGRARVGSWVGFAKHQRRPVVGLWTKQAAWVCRSSSDLQNLPLKHVFELINALAMGIGVLHYG